MADEELPILIVEDSSLQRELLRRLLTRANYVVITAKDGAEGLLQAQTQRPRLVISDIAMPNLDGYQLCRAIKDPPHLRSIPVMLLTELSDPKEIIRGLEAGADNYMTKPYDDQELLDRIRSLLAAPLSITETQVEAGLPVTFAGEQYIVTSNRQQILNLLLSTYENAVQRNRELLRTQMELRKLNEHLEEKVRERTQQLELANKAKHQFIANMSHELRTPMNAIIGMTDVVLGSSLDEEQRRFLEIVRNSADSLMIMLNSLLDFARMETGQLTINASPFPLRERLRWMLHPFAQRAMEKGLSFVCLVDGELPEQLRGDVMRLREILSQLTGNAIKFTEQGGVTLHVTRHPEESPGQEGISLRFRVEDTGVGIPETWRNTIFDSFSQGDGSATRKFGGTGLGLSLAHRLATLLEGRITYQSQVGQGTTFFFDLPLGLNPSGASLPAPPGMQILLEFHPDPERLRPTLRDPTEMSREELLNETERQLNFYTTPEENRPDWPEQIAQWLKLVAERLNYPKLKEDALRLAMAARKADNAKTMEHLAKIRELLETLRKEE